MSSEPRDPVEAARVVRRMVDARCLHEALALVRALEHTTTSGAGASLVDVGRATDHAPACVARELLHLVFPASHPEGALALTEAVRRRWAWPLHRLRHPDREAPTRVWDRVRGPGAVVASRYPRLN